MEALGPAVLNKLSKSEQSGWEWLTRRDETTSNEYAAAMSIPNRTALHHLKRFTELRLLQKTGSGPATVYRIMRK